MRELGHIVDAGLDLREEGCNLLKLLEPEQCVAGGVLEEDVVRGHDDTSAPSTCLV